MGRHDAVGSEDPRQVRRFTAALLADLEALERLLDDPRLASGPLHAGVEQEMFLVDGGGHPAPIADRVLEELDGRFTSELARFNLEANLPPVPLGGSFLEEIERRLDDAVEAAASACRPFDARPLLVGILPSLLEGDLNLDNMTDARRYRALARAALRLRGGKPFTIFIRGVEQFEASFDHPMPESANCSLQLHLQVPAPELTTAYNLAQLITAPMLAAATASPLFCGRRLWHETRVALFERAIDARTEGERARGLDPRVGFGSGWLERSCLEVFRDNVARYRPLLVLEEPEDSLASLARGEVPGLEALMLHSGTIWRWNRPCYGVSGGVPHLRIESRVLPSGPTVRDEMANAALFYGLMAELPHSIGDPASRLEFRAARANLVDVARLGLDVPMSWLDGEKIGARELLLGRLIPAAAEGLARLGVPASDVERHLSCLAERVSRGLTPSRWILSALDAQGATTGRALVSVTQRLLEAQADGSPLHAQPIVRPPRRAGDGDAEDRSETAAEALADARSRRVEEVMNGDLYTVSPEDAASLAFAVMEWRHVRHVPVEDHEGRARGVLDDRSWHRALRAEPSEGPTPVAAVMARGAPEVEPGTTLREVAKQLVSTGSDCALVTLRGRVMGIVTSRDLVRVVAGRRR